MIICIIRYLGYYKYLMAMTNYSILVILSIKYVVFNRILYNTILYL